MRRLFVLALAALPLATAVPADAALLTFNYKGAVFSLEAPGTACTTCSIVLGADFTGFTGDTSDDQVYLEAIQWKIDGAKIDSFSLTSWTRGGVAQPNTDWDFDIGEGVNNSDSQCSNGGGDASLCGDYVTGFGVDTTTAPFVYLWNFSVTFENELLVESGDAGNIRALFKDADGKKANGIFSPNGGTFDGDGDGGGDGGNVPEPGALLLIGAGLVGLAARLRHR